MAATEPADRLAGSFGSPGRPIASGTARIDQQFPVQFDPIAIDRHMAALAHAAEDAGHGRLPGSRIAAKLLPRGLDGRGNIGLIGQRQLTLQNAGGRIANEAAAF
jgi:hypothetical protein